MAASPMPSYIVPRSRFPGTSRGFLHLTVWAPVGNISSIPSNHTGGLRFTPYDNVVGWWRSSFALPDSYGAGLHSDSMKLNHDFCNPASYQELLGIVGDPAVEESGDYVPPDLRFAGFVHPTSIPVMSPGHFSLAHMSGTWHPFDLPFFHGTDNLKTNSLLVLIEGGFAPVPDAGQFPTPAADVHFHGHVTKKLALEEGGGVLCPFQRRHAVILEINQACRLGQQRPGDVDYVLTCFVIVILPVYHRKNAWMFRSLAADSTFTAAPFNSATQGTTFSGRGTCVGFMSSVFLTDADGGGDFDFEGTHFPVIMLSQARDMIPIVPAPGAGVGRGGGTPGRSNPSTPMKRKTNAEIQLEKRQRQQAAVTEASAVPKAGPSSFRVSSPPPRSSPAPGPASPRRQVESFLLQAQLGGQSRDDDGLYGPATPTRGPRNLTTEEAITEAAGSGGTTSSAEVVSLTEGSSDEMAASQHGEPDNSQEGVGETNILERLSGTGGRQARKRTNKKN